MKKNWMKKIPLVIGAVVLGTLAFSGLTMLLWNATVSPLFHISALTIWQAAGLLLLSKILFSGFKGRHHGGGWRQRKMMKMQWATLTDEQKEEFKKKMQEGCHGYRHCA